MPTIKDVAKKAGVSTATVSYYINHKPVSEEKAARIAAAIRELNYVIQSPGRDLRTRKNRTIGIVFPNISDPYYQTGQQMFLPRSFITSLTTSWPVKALFMILSLLICPISPTSSEGDTCCLWILPEIPFG